MPLPPSPGSAEHVCIDLANSRIQLPGHRVVDALETPASTTEWLVERGLVGEDASLHEYCQNRLAGLRRDVTCALAARVDHTELDPRVLDGINAALVAVPNNSLLHFVPDGGFFRSAEHPVTLLVEHAMSVIAEDLATLLTGDDAELLARCTAAPCERYFLKTHGRRQWCSIRCGDRVRAARAYARKREGLRQ